MDRNEAKLQMRQELEAEIDVSIRDRKMFPIGERLLSMNDLMQEVESGTDLGTFLLNDYINFKSGKGKAPELSAVEKAHAIALMEADLKSAPEGWADSVIFDEGGTSWTPNQIMAEVRLDTEFGNRYMVVYLTNHQMLESLLGKGYDQPGGSDLFSLPDLDNKKNDDQAN